MWKAQKAAQPQHSLSFCTGHLPTRTAPRCLKILANWPSATTGRSPSIWQGRPECVCVCERTVLNINVLYASTRQHLIQSSMQESSKLAGRCGHLHKASIHLCCQDRSTAHCLTILRRLQLHSDLRGDSRYSTCMEMCRRLWHTKITHNVCMYLKIYRLHFRHEYLHSHEVHSAKQFPSYI